MLKIYDDSRLENWVVVHFGLLILFRKESLILIAVLLKGKTIPLQAWTGPESSRRLRLPDLKTIGT
jgi:hypothetical protein